MTEEEYQAVGRAIKIKCYEIGHQEIRFVTWNDIKDVDIDNAIAKLSFVVQELEASMKKS